MVYQNTYPVTHLQNLFAPEVIGEMVNHEAAKHIVLTPLANVRDDFQGVAGSTVSMPVSEPLGDAENVTEGNRIKVTNLSQSFKKATVKKIGKGALVTDEAIQSGRAIPTPELLRQFAQGIAAKVDDELFFLLDDLDESRTYTLRGRSLEPSELPAVLKLFGEEVYGSKALIVDQETYAKIIDSKAFISTSRVASNMAIHGSVGMAYGMNVLVSDRVQDHEALYIVKPGALTLWSKRNVLVEADRDVVNQSTILTVSKLFAASLTRPDLAVKIKFRDSEKGFLVTEKRSRIAFGDTFIIV